jgi:hypothetical protein
MKGAPLRLFAGSPYLRLGAIAAIAAIIAGCGGGGVNTTPVSQPSSGSVMTSTTSTVALPSLTNARIGVNGTLGIGSIVTLVTESLLSSPPTGVPVLAAARNAATSSTRRSVADANALAPLDYVEFSSSATVTIAAGGTLSFTLPQIASGVTYNLAEFSATGWTQPVAGPGTVNGMTVTLSGLPSFTVASGSSVIFALYSVSSSPSPSPSPTPSPSPSPSPTPVPTPVAAPTSVVFDVNSPAPATVSVNEAGNSAAFSALLLCTANPVVPSPEPSSSPFVAELTTATSLTPSAAGGMVAFGLQPGSETGSCTLTVKDVNNASVPVSVLTSTTSLNVYSTHRK